LLSIPFDTELERIAKLTAFVRILHISFTGIFAIAKHVGIKQLYPTYMEILDKYNSLLSVRLIDVAIKLDCQAQLPLKVISDILDDLETNRLGKEILRRLAFNRMVLYETARVEKQRCCQMLGIRQDDPRLYLTGRKIGKV
jgi:hypothetical protein